MVEIIWGIPKILLYLVIFCASVPLLVVVYALSMALLALFISIFTGGNAIEIMACFPLCDLDLVKKSMKKEEVDFYETGGVVSFANPLFFLFITLCLCVIGNCFYPKETAVFGEVFFKGWCIIFALYLMRLIWVVKFRAWKKKRDDLEWHGIEELGQPYNTLLMEKVVQKRDAEVDLLKSILCNLKNLRDQNFERGEKRTRLEVTQKEIERQKESSSRYEQIEKLKHQIEKIKDQEKKFQEVKGSVMEQLISLRVDSLILETQNDGSFCKQEDLTLERINNELVTLEKVMKI